MAVQGVRKPGDGEANSPPKLVEHTGGCHCGAVRFKVKAPEDLIVDQCNCSVCTKKQLRGFDISKSKFTLLQGEDNITTYTFNTGTAKHTFCKTCGVQSFYTPRSKPDGYCVMLSCLDPGTVKSVKYEPFDGVNWEQAIHTHGAPNDIPESA